MKRRWKAFKTIVSVWVDLFDEHGLLTSAAAIALQAFVAMVALALLALALIGATGHQHVWSGQIAPQLEPKFLPEVYAGISATVEKVFSTDSTTLIVIAVLLAVWEVSGAVRACMSALSRVYGANDERPWYVRFPLSIGIAVLLILALAGSFVLIVGLRHAAGGAQGVLLAIGRWAGTIVLLTAAFTILVRFAPAERRSKRVASSGAALVVVAWIVQSLIFAWYLRSSASYRSAVGSLTAIYFFTTYFYVAAIVLLVGIELDEQLRRDADRETTGRRPLLTLVRQVVLGR
ncbi:MAG TPA: YihY/virulence factor BrkB family protein [Gaiellaceae bacterium]|nr:YihY/virulence factor BrkB family protein [Gaiellaceae bacterium]